jgi:hypothetical protein
VIAILEAISNSVSALPAVGSPAPLGSGAPALGGFAARLAAAQDVAAASGSRTVTSEAETSGESASESAGTAAGLNIRMPAGNGPAKKLLDGNPLVPVGVWAAANTVLPGFVPTVANPLSLPRQTNVTQTGVPELSPISNGVSGVVQLVGAQQSGTQQHGTQTSAYQDAAKAASSGYTAGYSASSLANLDGAAEVQSSGQANGQDAAPTNVAQPPVLRAIAGGTVSGGADGSPNTALGNQWDGKLSFASSVEDAQPSVLLSSSANSSAKPASGSVVREVAPVSVENDSQAELAPVENTLLASNTPPSALSTANAQPLSTAGWQDGVAAAATSGSPVQGLGSGAGEPIAQAVVTGPTLLASANSGAGVVVRVQSSAEGDIPIGQVDSSSAIAPAADQVDSAAQMAPVRSAVRVATSRATAAVSSPSVRSAGASAPASTPTLVSATEAGNGTAASQTPFSIFFSSPGPGTESAASTLPKMILPATSSAVRESHIGAADASSVSPLSGGVHGGVSTNNAAQNAAPPNSGDTTAGQSGSLSTGQALHADPTAATAAVAAAAPALAPSPVASGSAGATLPLIQATASVDALPKAGTAAGAGNPATPLPAAAEPAPATVAGPVQMAQMMSRVGQAEMRIGVNTSAFGSVEVRTVVHASDVGLTIGSEKGDLRGLLGNEMPALTNSLQQQNLRLSSINFTQGFASSGNGSGGGDSQQHSFVPAPASSSFNSVSSEVAGEDFADLPPLGGFGGGNGSLSILA